MNHEKQTGKNHFTNKWHVRTMTFALMLTMITWLLPTNWQGANASTNTSGLSNPTTATDGTVTWDCVWFGHYPQSSDGKGGYNKEPIKWRVLSVNGDETLLLADKNLDCKKYNETYTPGTPVTWETSTIRSWLNGYGTDANKNGEDYTSDNFIDKAFSPTEQEAINQNAIQNPNNPEYGTAGGNSTADKMFLLSMDEVTKPAYGFPNDYNKYSRTRTALNTEYAKAQGANTSISTGYKGNGVWWLRSPGGYSYYAYAAAVYNYGAVSCVGDRVDRDRTAVRPALFLNLKSNLWSNAGTVSSEGTVEEKGNDNGSKSDGFFKIGRDSNEFLHVPGTFGYNDDRTECTVFSKTSIGTICPTSLDYYSRLVKGLDFNQEIALLDEMNGDKWNGSCAGLEISIALANMKMIDVASIGEDEATCYSDLAPPFYNLELRDLINYYQLMQHADKLPITLTLWSKTALESIANGDGNPKTWSWDTFWDHFLPEAKNAAKNKVPLLLGVGYGKDRGHALLTCGYDDSSNVNYTIITLYDCNYSSLAYQKATGSGGDFLYLFVSKTKKDFSFSTSKDKITEYSNYASKDDWRYFRYCDMEKMKSFDSNLAKGASMASTPSKEKTVAEQKTGSKTGVTAFQVNAAGKFHLQNASGEYLQYDGTEYGGNMEVHDIEAMGEENQTLKFTVDSSNEFRISNLSDGCKYSLYMGDNYYTVKTSGANAVTMSLANGIQITGTDYAFVSGLSEKKLHGLLRISGNCSADSNINYAGDGVGLATSGKFSSIKVEGVTTNGIVEKEFDGAFSKATINPIDYKAAPTQNDTKKETVIQASNITKAYGCKPFKLGASTNSDGKLSYKSGNQKVATVSQTGTIAIKGTGKTTVTIATAATKKYKADTKKITLTVKPKKMAAPRLKSKRPKTLTVSWKKDAKASGYQVKVATDKKFKKNKKTVNIKKNKTVTKTFKKLKRKKTYYAKVRAYKKVGTKKVYGAYSKVKKARVK